MEIKEFKLSDHLYSIPICEIESNGDLQLQLDRDEWNHEQCYLELPNGEILSVNKPKQLICNGDLFIYWGENGRLYISGNGFKAKDVIHRKIGNRLIVKSKL